MRRYNKVSAVAASFLESIRNQPMLCLGAVNPHIYARVPLLAKAGRLFRASTALEPRSEHDLPSG